MKLEILNLGKIEFEIEKGFKTERGKEFIGEVIEYLYFYYNDLVYYGRSRNYVNEEWILDSNSLKNQTNK